jgi:hypothetical protein
MRNVGESRSRAWLNTHVRRPCQGTGRAPGATPDDAGKYLGCPAAFSASSWKPQTSGVTGAMWQSISRTTSLHDARSLRASTAGFRTWFCLSVWIMSLSGCAFFPEQIADEATQNACRISAPEWKLTFAEINNVNVCQSSGKDAAYCLLTIGLIVPAGSFVVSGSIVVVGNTLHWLEYQGRCKDSFLNQQLVLFKKRFVHNNAE